MIHLYLLSTQTALPLGFITNKQGITGFTREIPASAGEHEQVVTENVINLVKPITYMTM